MSELLASQDVEFRQAYLENERQERVNTGKVACLLVAALMPLGVALDAFVYQDKVVPFLIVRLACSALAIGLWMLHRTGFGERHYKALGLPIALLPAAAIAWMIYDRGGAASPYYAGLNLILLAVSVVVRWSVKESFLAVLGVIVMYAVACLPGSEVAETSAIFNNFYFLVLTGIIVVTGNYFFSQLRYREFRASYQLDRSKQALEVSNQKLSGQNAVLEETITKLKEAESQLVQSEKLASLGRMSAGIIHEINNPINYAKTNLYTLRNKGRHLAKEQQEEYADIIQEIEDGIDRVRNIVSDLRLFTHPAEEHLDQADVADALTSGLRFLSNEWKDRIHIEQNLMPQQTVHANKTKLIHLFTNLLQNSIDALAQKPFNNGELPTIWIEGRAEPGHSVLVIRDNGPGIEGQHLDKVFDPFFTTKDVGEGMGLGLSICYRIMQESGGKISVRSEPGKFCEFTLDFPEKG